MLNNISTDNLEPTINLSSSNFDQSNRNNNFS